MAESRDYFLDEICKELSGNRKPVSLNNVISQASGSRAENNQPFSNAIEVLIENGWIKLVDGHKYILKEDGKDLILKHGSFTKWRLFQDGEQQEIKNATDKRQELEGLNLTKQLELAKSNIKANELQRDIAFVNDKNHATNRCLAIFNSCLMVVAIIVSVIGILLSM